MDDVWSYLSFLGRLLGVASVTLLISWRVRSGLGWLPLWSVLRALLQLAAVAVVLRYVFTDPWATAGFLLLMLSVASLVSVRRTRELWHGGRGVVAGVVVGSVVSVGAVLLLHLVALEPRYVIAVSGIVIGNAMSAATLTGRNFRRSSLARMAEVEAWFALGAAPAVAHREISEESIREALIPNLDQAKSTGLVTLPGAFVGALFGGATPVEAARFQLVVLVGIALAMIITATVMTRIVQRSPFLAAESRGQ